MLSLDAQIFAQINTHARESYPNECCGVLLGHRDESERVVTRAVECRNADPTPSIRYTVEPADLISIQRDARNHHLEIVGFYHSHPDHPPSPSQSDLDEADWTGCSYVIVSVESRNITGARSFVLEEVESRRLLVEEPLAVSVSSAAE